VNKTSEAIFPLKFPQKTTYHVKFTYMFGTVTAAVASAEALARESI
jgi:hypothetical protein